MVALHSSKLAPISWYRYAAQSVDKEEWIYVFSSLVLKVCMLAAVTYTMFLKAALIFSKASFFLSLYISMWWIGLCIHKLHKESRPELCFEFLITPWGVDLEKMIPFKKNALFWWKIFRGHMHTYVFFHTQIHISFSYVYIKYSTWGHFLFLYICICEWVCIHVFYTT